MIIRKQIITSRSNPAVAETVKLQKKHVRDDTGLFVCEGRKLSSEYIKVCGAPYAVYVNESRSEEIIPELETLEQRCGVSLDVTLVGDSAFCKMTEQSASDGIIVIGEKNKLDHERIGHFDAEKYTGERMIILSSLQDSGNVGTVIRTALALGYDRVVLSSDCADIYSRKTLRAAMGAAFSIKLTVCDSVRAAVVSLVSSGREVYAAELRENAVSLDSLGIGEYDVFIIGNEGHGIDTDVSAQCSASVYIPISRHSESLNAAVAASVIMWQQRSASFVSR